MKSWFCRKRLEHHAKKQGVDLQLYGVVDMPSLSFDLYQGAAWHMAQGSNMGKDAVIVLGQQAAFNMGKQSLIGRRFLLKMVAKITGQKVSAYIAYLLEDDIKLIEV